MTNVLNNSIIGNKANMPGFEDDYSKVLSKQSQKLKNLYSQAATYKELLKNLSKKYNIEEQQHYLKTAKLTYEERKKLEAKLHQDIVEIEQRAIAGTSVYRQQMYKKGSAEMKAAMLKTEADLLDKKLDSLDKQYAEEWALAEGNGKLRRQLTLQHKKDTIDVINQASKLRAQQRALENSEQMKSIQRLKREFSELKDDISLENVDKVVHALARVDIAAIDKELEARIEKASEDIEQLELDYDRMVELGASQKELDAKRDEINATRREKTNDELKKALTAIAVKIQDSYKEAFNQAENIMNDYRSHIDARLQGSEKNYDDVMDKISSNLSMSPYVKTQKVIENMRTAVDQGIAYNVEQRAFLATISDKIANTFDAFDSNLTRLIRLQQADTTAARLGMEASLTKFFNNMFQDTSYLSDMYDSVSAAIIDANASLTRDQSAEFEYIVQKWLGSLGSLGMSNETITNIASGLNYIATGDVTSLSSNNQLQTLFAMSASKAGLEYSDLLLNGLNADNTNALLESMVTYLKEIAENSDSQVVRSAYGDIFNMSLSDMKAISNLSNSDISNISSSSMTYGAMNSELNNQMLQVIKRTSLAESLSNLYENAIFSVAEDMASNPATWAMTKMLDFMKGQKLEMAIPFVNAWGSGVNLNTSVQDIMRLGVGLSQAFSLMGNILDGLGSIGGLKLNAWGATEYTQRGSGMTFTTGSTFGTTSGSTYVSTSSSQDMKNSALSTAADEADETSKITNKNAKVEHTFDDFYNATIGESAKSYIRVQDVLFEQVYNSDQNFLGSRDSRMTFDTEGNLNVSNSSMGYMLSWLFGTNPLHEDGRLKVNVQDKTFRIKPEDNVLPVHIASIAESIKSASSVVTLSPGTNVSIDETTLVNAFKKAMGYNKKSDEIMNIGDLIELLQSGSIVIPVTNPTGQRMQVDTELSGTSGYVAGNRVVW